MIWLLLAAQLSAPVPTNQQQWFTPDDVPIEELTLEQLTVVPYRLVVEPNGRVQKCFVEVSSGNANVDSLTCNLLKSRARFHPARDPAGRPAYGVYRSFAKWFVTERPRMPGPLTAPDVEVTVAQLPQGVQSPAAVQLMFAVDEKGQTSACTGARAGQHPALVKVGCNQLLKSFAAQRVVTPAGVPVLSVQNAVVVFVKQ